MFEMMKQFDALHFEIISCNTKQGLKPIKIINGETYRTEGLAVKIVDCKYVRTLIRTGQFKLMVSLGRNHMAHGITQTIS